MALLTGPMLVDGVLESGGMYDSTPQFSSPDSINANNWSTYQYQAEFSPSDADVVLLVPVPGVTWNPATDIAELSFDTPGTYEFTLRATKDGVSTDHVITVVVDGRPEFFNDPVLNVPAGAINPVTIEVSDPEGAVVTLSAITMPSGLVFTPNPVPQNTSNGLVYVGSITGSLPGGVHPCTIRAVSANGGGQTDFTLTINAASASNSAPIITSGNSVIVVQGQPVNHVLSASDANADTINWSVSSAYSWVSLSGSQLTVAPDQSVNGGTYQVVVTANDGQATVNQTINIQVVEAAVNAQPSGTDFNTPAWRTVIVDRIDYDSDTKLFFQDVLERYDYCVDVVRWLEGDLIDSVTWLPSPGISITDGGFNESCARVWVNGGVDGSIYRITCLVSTGTGRVHKVWFDVSVSNEGE